MTGPVNGAEAGSTTPSADGPVARLLAASGWDARVTLDDSARKRMQVSRETFARFSRTHDVYGVTRGFGPLVGYPADPDRGAQGLGLVRHLATGQGRPLPPAVTRTMLWLRLRSMAAGHSAVDTALWQALADQWNAGFTPVVPEDGSLSASGDLVPLAHAALAATGADESQRAWADPAGPPDGGHRPPGEVLRRLGVPGVVWDARGALAFVNGSSAGLALALHNHRDLAGATRLAAVATGRLAAVLGADPDPYHDALSRVRNQPGQRRAAALIRAELPPGHVGAGGRPLQERYSLRCAPQVLGAVLDQLRFQEEVLVAEAEGCTDNPVTVDGTVRHGGNFHAAPVALASESHAGCVHQVALLMERQLALLLDPRANGGLPPLLAARPGRDSGLAGVQIAASSHLSRIRQFGYPASMTTIPTNLDNQDHVPLALNSAVAVAGMLTRLRWIAGALLLALTEAARRTGSPADGLWEVLADAAPPLLRDRPLAGEVAALAELALGTDR
ncbi:aromatic amino acid ammonia-lyase [Streptomyces sp. DH12]|uniref:aromatic amino acid ammonia-lyase n=1 Tax=Streptomyces sp. DH12 TaxID=2857010 RepID=UPI001E64B19C|nr:aromatic amino acid ammonia-lyase [Streptomyces sp. DH12]